MKPGLSSDWNASSCLRRVSERERGLRASVLELGRIFRESTAHAIWNLAQQGAVHRLCRIDRSG